jgi:hypothetical protein
MKKSHREELHNLYSGLNGGGCLIERQWEYWDTRIRHETLKLNETIQFAK